MQNPHAPRRTTTQPGRADTAVLDAVTPAPTAVWWLRVASAGPYMPHTTAEERELARRSDLVAWLALGLLGGGALLIPIAVADMTALLALAGFDVCIVFALALNRSGLVHTAGVLLVLCIVGALLSYMLSSPLGLTMGQLPNYDAFAVAVVVAASILPRGSAFVVAALNAAVITADYLLQPHNPNIAADAALYPSVTQQTIALLARPLALQFVFAVIAFLWVRGTDRAIRRADRAEELAEVERRERSRTVALEEGARYLHQTLTMWIAGDFRPRMPAMPVPVLQRLSDDLNMFITRFSAQTQVDFQYNRMREEAQRLAAALQARAEGRPNVLPAPTGTPLDAVIEALRRLGTGGPGWTR